MNTKLLSIKMIILFCFVIGQFNFFDETLLTLSPTANASENYQAKAKQSKKKKLKRLLGCALPGKRKKSENLIMEFVDAQAKYHDIALAELQAGKKRSHWSWYIFPTPPFLGLISDKSNYYAIRTKEQGVAYLTLPAQEVSMNPLQVGESQEARRKTVHLRNNYILIMETIADQLEENEDLTLKQLIGIADIPKLKSSLAYFREIASSMSPPDHEVAEVCDRTLEAIEEASGRAQSLRESLRGFFGQFSDRW